MGKQENNISKGRSVKLEVGTRSYKNFGALLSIDHGSSNVLTGGNNEYSEELTDFDFFKVMNL